jgi:hypothetical protein
VPLKDANLRHLQSMSALPRSKREPVRKAPNRVRICLAFSYLDLRHTAIDANFAAVHEGGVVGGEKQSRRRDLF